MENFEVKKEIDVEKIRQAYEILNREIKPRLVNPKPDYEYVWVHKHPQLVAIYQNLGYRAATKSDVQVEGLKPTAEGHWESGPDLLMLVERAKREKMIAQQKLLTEFQLGKIKTDFHNEAYRLGVQSIETETDEEGHIKIVKG